VAAGAVEHSAHPFSGGRQAAAGPPSRDPLENWRLLRFRVHPDLHERTKSMPDWMTDWWFLGLMALILVALIGLLLFLRNKRPED
jgi:disulfide bond formation protein DsbB